MQRFAIVTIASLALAACGQEAAKAPEKAAVPAKLPAGNYEITRTIKTLASTDKTPLPTFAKQGDVIQASGCVGADGLPEPALLATKGDSCQLQNPYVRGGRMNATLDCNRKGQGKVMAMLDGKYDSVGFTGTLTSNSSFVGPGDFKLVEEVVARKTADQCTAAPAAEKKA